MVLRKKIVFYFVPLGFFAAFFLLFHRFWGHSIVYSDSFVYLAPAKYIVGKALRSGSIYAWDPYLFLGIPFIGEAQAGWFYPLNIFYLIFPFELAHRLFILINYPLASIFMYMFLRGRGFERRVSILCGMFFSLCGTMTGQHAYLTTLIAFTWAPLAFYLIERSFNGSKSWALGAGAVLAFQVYVGAPEVAFLTAFLMAIFCLLKSGDGFSRLPAFISLVTAGASSFLFSVVQLLPTLEMVQRSTRSLGVPYREATLFSFHPARIIELIWPLPFGTLWPEGYYWGRFAIDASIAPNPWNISNYAGMPILFFAVVGIVGSRRKFRYLVGAGSAFFLLLSFGRYLPVFPLVHKVVPFFSLFRYPERFMGWFAFFTAIGAAMGLEHAVDSIGSGKKIFMKGVVIYSSVVATLLVLSAIFWPIAVRYVTDLPVTDPEYRFIISGLYESGKQFFIINALVVFMGYIAFKGILSFNKTFILTCMVVVLDLYLVNVSNIPSGPRDIYEFDNPSARAISPGGKPDLGRFRICKTNLKFIPRDHMMKDMTLVELVAVWRRSVLGNNLQMIEGLEDFKGYYPLVLKNGIDSQNKIDDFELLKLYNVEYLVTNYNEITANDRLGISEIFGNAAFNVKIYRLTDVWPRAYSVWSAVAVKSEKEALNATAGEDMKKVVVITSDEKFDDDDHYKADYEEAEVISYTPDRVELETNNDRPGWLVLSDRYYPGWQAAVNNEAVKIYKANVMVRAVKIPSGRNRVIFSFRPRAFHLAGFVSLTTWIMAVLWWVLEISAKLFKNKGKIMQ